MQLEDVLRAYNALPDEKKKEVSEAVRDETKEFRWVPNPGPQLMAYLSEADELFYGGAAGGGKSDLILGVALNVATTSRIFRRQFKDFYGVGGLAPRLAEILGSWGGFHKQAHLWRRPNGKELEFAAFSNATEAEAYQGRPADYYAFDEITQFEEHLVRFLMTWNRSTKTGQRTRMICTGNPPVTAEGRWVIKYWGPWLDPQHPMYPVPAGELRWVTTINGEDVWYEEPGFVEVNGEQIKLRSRTFIPAKLSDNPDLIERDDYRATLAALPEPYRSAFRDGNFGAGLQDHEWQVIPTEWALKAQQRWEARKDLNKGPMTAMGVDIAQGGPDKTVLSPLYNFFFAPLIREKGINTKNGADVAALVIRNVTDGATINIDCGGGWGGSAFEHLDSNGANVQSCIGASGSQRRDRSGKFTFKNKRAEWWWSFREALDPDTGDNIALPPDGDLLADLTSVRRKPTETAAVIQIEDKEELKKRLGRSPDDGDAVVLAWAYADPDLLRERKSKNRRRSPDSVKRPVVTTGYDKAKDRFHKRRS